MVVCLDFENHVVFIVKFHNTCIVLEDANTPIVRSQTFSNLHRCSEDCFLEHALEMPRTILISILDFAAKRFVTAVLAPRLSNCLQFNISWIAALFSEMLLNCIHLGDR